MPWYKIVDAHLEFFRLVTSAPSLKNDWNIVSSLFMVGTHIFYLNFLSVLPKIHSPQNGYWKNERQIG
jgi:hypothetical protein